MKLTLVRGAPGAGKSTHALNLKGMYKEGVYDGVVVLEADQYFLRPDGVYDFSPKLIPNAHKWCQRMALENLMGWHEFEFPWVIVANTFTRLWEMQPYLDMAEEFGAAVEVHRCSGEYQNIHGVPDDKVRQMRERMEPFDGEVWV